MIHKHHPLHHQLQKQCCFVTTLWCTALSFLMILIPDLFKASSEGKRILPWIKDSLIDFLKILRTPSYITKIVCPQANVNLQIMITMVTKPKTAKGAQAGIKARQWKWVVLIISKSEISLIGWKGILFTVHLFIGLVITARALLVITCEEIACRSQILTISKKKTI